MHDCPTDETLAAFVDGRLDPAARARVIEHVSECSACRDVILLASEIAAETETGNPSTGMALRLFRWPGSVAVLAAAAALVIVLLTPALRDLVLANRGGMGSVAEAAGSLEHRSIVTRTSADLRYKPVKPVLRSGGAPPPQEWRLLKALANLETRASRKPAADTLHALGVAYLLNGNDGEAVGRLEEVLRLETGVQDAPDAVEVSTNAGLLSDLAAAYHARAAGRQASGDTARDWDMALRTSARALSLDPQSAAAAWNRALILESVRDRTGAREAWQRYLRLDPDSPWAAEAKLHHAELGADLPSQ